MLEAPPNRYEISWIKLGVEKVDLSFVLSLGSFENQAQEEVRHLSSPAFHLIKWHWNRKILPTRFPVGSISLLLKLYYMRELYIGKYCIRNRTFQCKKIFVMFLTIWYGNHSHSDDLVKSASPWSRWIRICYRWPSKRCM